jgi:hypothetical protein
MPAITVQSSKLSSTFPKKNSTSQENGSLTCIYCASTGQSNTFHGMGFHYRFSRGDRVQIIYGKHKGATGTVDANVFQRSVDFPKDHLPCHNVLPDDHLVITINVNQVEPLESL